MAEIQFTPQAVEDLKGIKDYITEELCSEVSAKKTVEKIMERIRQLSDFPELGAPLRSIIQYHSDYRFLVCGNYMVFYRFENDWVNIIRILYGRRNFMRILFGDPEK